MKAVLSIAGSDCSGGAGIQADLKTVTLLGVYAMSAVTALTAQNTTGVRAVLEADPAFLAAQIDAVFEDIRPHAVKIGMVSSAALAEVIAERLAFYKAENIVVDPVMAATSGSALTAGDAIAVMRRRLFPMAAVITPNIPEAEVLAGRPIRNEGDMEEAAAQLQADYGCAVLLKGGHSVRDASDLLCQGGTLRWFHGRRIENPNTHGTGCTLSSAMAAYLARGCTLTESVEGAKAYVSGALAAMLDLGRGSGPMDHGWLLREVSKT